MESSGACFIHAGRVLRATGLNVRQVLGVVYGGAAYSLFVTMFAAPVTFDQQIREDFVRIQGAQDPWSITFIVQSISRMLFSLLGGLTVDFFGRKWPPLIAYTLSIVLVVLSTLHFHSEHEFIVFLAFRCFIIAFAAPAGMFCPLYAAEIIGSEHRAWVFLGAQTFCSLVSIGISAFIYTSKKSGQTVDWRSITNRTYPAFIVFALPIIFFPESPLWCLVNRLPRRKIWKAFASAANMPLARLALYMPRTDLSRIRFKHVDDVNPLTGKHEGYLCICKPPPRFEEPPPQIETKLPPPIAEPGNLTLPLSTASTLGDPATPHSEELSVTALAADSLPGPLPFIPPGTPVPLPRSASHTILNFDLKRTTSETPSETHPFGMSYPSCCMADRAHSAGPSQAWSEQNTSLWKQAADSSPSPGFQGLFDKPGHGNLWDSNRRNRNTDTPNDRQKAAYASVGYINLEDLRIDHNRRSASVDRRSVMAFVNRERRLSFPTVIAEAQPSCQLHGIIEEADSEMVGQIRVVRKRRAKLNRQLLQEAALREELPAVHAASVRGKVPRNQHRHRAYHGGPPRYRSVRIKKTEPRYVSMPSSRTFSRCFTFQRSISSSLQVQHNISTLGYTPEASINVVRPAVQVELRDYTQDELEVRLTRSFQAGASVTRTMARPQLTYAPTVVVEPKRRRRKRQKRSDARKELSSVALRSARVERVRGPYWIDKHWRFFAPLMLAMQKPYAATTLPLCAIWFLSAWSYWGLVAYCSTLLVTEGIDDGLVTLIEYVFQVPAHVLTFKVMTAEWGGRKAAMKVCSSLNCVVTVVLALMMSLGTSNTLAISTLVILIMSMGMAKWSPIISYSVERYPTELRGALIGLVSASTGLATLTTTYIAKVTANVSSAWLMPWLWGISELGVYLAVKQLDLEVAAADLSDERIQCYFL